MGHVEQERGKERGAAIRGVKASMGGRDEERKATETLC